MTWISVKDRLPKEGEQVLAISYHPKHGYEYRLDYVIHFEGGGNIWCCRIEDDFNFVTHWMPLPEQPKH